jgi:hypothetical protein
LDEWKEDEERERRDLTELEDLNSEVRAFCCILDILI